MPHAPHDFSGLTVSAAEAGMKLLRFLERRFGGEICRSALYKWIRTGQVRVNGGRATPHGVLAEGDAVRVPPFAAPRALGGEPCPALLAEEGETASDRSPAPGAPTDLGSGLALLATAGDILVLNKAAGLASQPGCGDSVAARLRCAFQGSVFVPAPAHRLDKHTSGLMVAGLTHRAQRHLHELVKEGGMVKEYLAWTCGCAWHEQPRLLRDALFVTREGKRELVAARPGDAGEVLLEPQTTASRAIGHAIRDESFVPPGGAEGYGKRGGAASGGQALCAVAAVMTLAPQTLPKALQSASPLLATWGATLLLVRLMTGRKHQIRVQLSSRGYPIIGDGRYGGPRFSHMLLHAFALSFAAPSGGGLLSFSVLPDWPEPFMPDAATIASAQARLRDALQ